jgi:hypothetical protein
MFDPRYEDPVDRRDLTEALWNARSFGPDADSRAVAQMRMRRENLLEEEMRRAGTSLRRRSSVVPLLEGCVGTVRIHTTA